MSISISYLAGFTDGEGCIRVRHRRVSIIWGQNTKKVLVRIKKFLAGHGIRSNLYRRPPNPDRGVPNESFVLCVTYREGVYETCEMLLPKLIVKKGDAIRVLNWMDENPKLVNNDPIDADAVRRLAAKGWTQGRVARKMKCSTMRIGKIARENEISFSTKGWRTVDGKRVRAMTEEEYKEHKSRKNKTSRCSDCGKPCYYVARRCRSCADLWRTGRESGRGVGLNGTCDNCGGKIKIIPFYEKRYVNHFCSQKCRGEFGSRKNRWSKKQESCVECGGTEHPHVAHGRCKKCHERWYRNHVQKRQAERRTGCH